MAEVVANGITFHVQRLGREPGVGDGTPPRLGPPAPSVVLIHGLFIDNMSSLYYSLANPLARAGADAIFYDLRGHGRSEQPTGGYTMQQSIDDMLAVAGALGAGGPLHLVGHSYGASLALRAGLMYPGRIASLTLIEPHCAETADGGSWTEDILDSLTATALGMERAAVPAHMGPSAARKLRSFRSTDHFLNATSLIEDVAAAPPFDDEELRALTVPTMAVFGEDTDLASSIAKLVRAMPACRMEIFTGVGHSVLRDAAAMVLELLVEWLDDCSGVLSGGAVP
jgi:pimeloyl-ACP methyl ester carboxylesterase